MVAFSYRERRSLSDVVAAHDCQINKKGQFVGSNVNDSTSDVRERKDVSTPFSDMPIFWQSAVLRTMFGENDATTHLLIF
jgi:hypothetical protein